MARVVTLKIAYIQPVDQTTLRALVAVFNAGLREGGVESVEASASGQKRVVVSNRTTRAD